MEFLFHVLFFCDAALRAAGLIVAEINFCRLAGGGAYFSLAGKVAKVPSRGAALPLRIP